MPLGKAEVKLRLIRGKVSVFFKQSGAFSAGKVTFYDEKKMYEPQYLHKKLPEKHQPQSSGIRH
jgi:hypothetical protein